MTKKIMGTKKVNCIVCAHEKAQYIRETYCQGGFRVLEEEGLKFARNTLEKCTKTHRPEELNPDINASLDNGAEIIAVPDNSAQIILSTPSLPELKKEKEKVYSITSREGWTEKLEEYVERVENLLTLCEKTKQIHHFTALSHVIAKLLELSGKSAGVFQPDTAIQINTFTNSEDYKRLKQIIISTLIPYPEALEAVGEALKNSGM